MLSRIHLLLAAGVYIAGLVVALLTHTCSIPAEVLRILALAPGVPRNIVAFVIPTGYSFNMDGGAIYLALASIFVAQAAAIPFGWKAQLVMVATLTLTSKGIAGVPRGSLVVLMATAASFHLPLEPVVLILGVDALMDMGRTTINVTGNCLASVVVARWEGKFVLSEGASEISSQLSS